MNIGQGGMDESFFSDAEQECAVLFEEPCTVYRWASTSGADDALMTKGTDVYNALPSTVNITEMGIEEISHSNSLYSFGDLKAEFRIPIFGEESQSGDGLTVGRKADQVSYRGRRYKIVGHVFNTFIGRTVFYKTVLRQI